MSSVDQTSKPVTKFLRDYSPPDFTITEVKLDVKLQEDHTLVAAQLHVQKQNPTARHMWLDGRKLELLDIAVDSKPLAAEKYEVSDEGLLLKDAPEHFYLQTTVKIYPHKNTELQGLYKSGSMYCTQCEAEGFRSITFFMDRPDVLSTYEVKMTADQEQYPVMLANGNLIESGTSQQGRHWVRWQDPFKKPCYLFAMVAGNLEHIEDTFTTCNGRKVDLKLYTEPENISKCDFAMESLKRSMKWDEEAYGREYDLDIYMIVAVNDFNMGAMENKGLNIFNTKYILAKPDTAIDSNYQDIEAVVGHEYFHNWSGNRVTCRDWFQLSLKEGFTVFRDQQFSAAMGSPGVCRIDDVNALRSHQFPEDDGPLAHSVRPESYVEINNFYTTTIYNKGAEVIRMLYTLLGPQTFRKACDEYFLRFDGQAVTCDDFVQVMQEISGIDLDQFKLWYSQAGTPTVNLKSSYDTSSQRLTLQAEQVCPDTPGQTGKKPMFIPISVGLLSSESGSAYDFGDGVATKVLHLTAEKQEFSFDGVAAKPVLSLLRGFSAPVKVNYDYSDDELSFLMQRDSDSFARWEAAQKLFSTKIYQAAAHKEGAFEGSDKLISTVSHLLENRHQDSDLALLARVLTPPTQSYLLDHSTDYHIENICQSQKDLVKLIAEQTEQLWLNSYEDFHSREPYQFDIANVARRAFKNCCLSYLGALGEKHLDLIADQYHRANNMTDQLAALNIIASIDSSKRAECLDSFYERWKHEPLVVDKWLMVQALSDVPNVLENIRAIMASPAFKITNPNNVYALIGSFFKGNPYYFHAADGSGYEFLAEQVIKIDSLNPQVSARMVSGLLRWKKMDGQRQDKMRAQLERILGQSELSKNVYELVFKSLQS